MSRARKAPEGFACPYRDRCPEAGGLPVRRIYDEHHDHLQREDEHFRIRGEMAREIHDLHRTLRERDAEIDRLKAENKILHQRVRIVPVAAPSVCPHCQSTTDPERGGERAYLQEDIELCPVTVVTRFEHATSWCPCCRRQVAQG